jgi:hypothetical protein
MRCDFCDNECDGKLVLRDFYLKKKDGSDVVLCSECLNDYANADYGSLRCEPQGGIR